MKQNVKHSWCGQQGLESDTIEKNTDSHRSSRLQFYGITALHRVMFSLETNYLDRHQLTNQGKDVLLLACEVIKLRLLH